MAQVEPKVVGDFLLAEGAANLSRKVFTVPTGQNLKLGQVCRTDSSGRKVSLAGTGNEAHTYNPDAAPTAGTFVLHLWHKDGYWVATAHIAFDATNTAIAAAINAVLGTSAVSVAGTAATAIVVTFSGTGYAGLSQPTGWMDLEALVGAASCPVTRSTSAGAAVNQTDVINVSGTPSGGTLRLWVDQPDGSRVVTNGIAYDATFANVITNINSALDTATGVSGGIVASGSAWTAITLTYSGTGYAGKPFNMAQIIVSSLTGATVADVAPGARAGAAGAASDKLADSIALEDVDASAAAKDAVFLVREAVVNRSKLYFGSADPDACVASLEKVNIVARREPSTKQVGP